MQQLLSGSVANDLVRGQPVKAAAVSGVAQHNSQRRQLQRMVQQDEGWMQQLLCGSVANGDVTALVKNCREDCPTTLGCCRTNEVRMVDAFPCTKVRGGAYNK